MASDLLMLDARHLWHPYSPAPATDAPVEVVSASGVRLRLADGTELVDGMASWWCAIHGYRHPVLDRAVSEQLARMAHIMFGGLTHEPAVRLAARLAEWTPHGLDRVFFADSGSVAVEVAIKMSLQYWRARGRPERHRLLTVRGGYHGDTFGAMTVCDPVGGMHAMFSDALTRHVFADRPPAGFSAGLDNEYAAQVADLVERHAGELAAVIVEPVVQGPASLLVRVWEAETPSTVPSPGEAGQAHPRGGDLPGILTVVEGVRRRGRVGFVTALFFSGLAFGFQAGLERDDAFDLVPLGIASRQAFLLRAQQTLGLLRLHG